MHDEIERERETHADALGRVHGREVGPLGVAQERDVELLRDVGEARDL